MKRAFNSLLQWLISMRLPGLAAILVSVAVSLLDRRPTRARWDGEDWGFTWSDGCLFSSSHQIRPKFVTEQNIGLYLTEYKPKPGDTVVEVGAGTGTEVCTLSNMVGPTGRVIAIEADPTAVRLLKKQADRLQYSNVTVVETAVGEVESILELSIGSPGGVGNSTAARISDQTISVPCRPLKRVLCEIGIDHISFIKFNIEGAEYEALIGLGSTIRQTDHLFVSCHDFTGIPGQNTFDDVYGFLKSQGMNLATLPPNPEKPWEQFYIFGDWGGTSL